MVYGLFGPNGHGKTTLLKILSGILQPSSGEVIIDNEKINYKSKSEVSFLPDAKMFYKWMKVKDALEYYRDFFTDFDMEKAEDLLTFMTLDKNLKISSLSKGMVARLMLTLVLSRNAKIYLLDEPLNGIDPISREKIIQTILSQVREDSSMIISSHMVDKVESLVDNVIFISNGNIIVNESAESIRDEKGLSIDEYYLEVFENEKYN
jgi:ABC-2 type transport system ATP-binding protein